MAEEWRPGLLAERLARVRVEGEAKLTAALREVALTIERGAKAKALDGGTHRYGTPTPAARGSGPAVISGTLRRSIVTTPLTGSGSNVEIRVGMAAGVFPPQPPYPRSARTPSSRYALYLETVWGYPFLGPAFRDVMGSTAQAIWLKHFAAWPLMRG